MIWFDPDKRSGFDLGTPDWSGASTRVADDEEVSNIIIGEAFQKPRPKAAARAIPEPVIEPDPQPPPPPPKPMPDPRVENQLKLLAASISELAVKKKALDERDLNFCVEMAFAIAEQLTCGSLEAHPEQVSRIVAESLGMFEDDDQPTVRLHPEIIAAFEEHGLLESIESMDNVTIRPDPSVSQLGCIVQAGRKTVNGIVPDRLDRLKTLYVMEQGGEI